MKFSTKLTFFSLGIVLFAALAISYAVSTTNIKIIEKQIEVSFEGLALHTMDMIDRMLFERLADIEMMAIDPVLSSQDSTPEAITKRLIDFRDNYKTYVSLSFFDLNRVRIADTAGLHLGKQHEVVQWTIDSIDNGIVSVAKDIRVAEDLKQAVIYFSAPVKDVSGKTFGAVVARVPLNKLFEIVKDASTHFKEKNVEVNLYNKKGLLLYSNYNRNGILKDNFAGTEKIQIEEEKKSGTIKHSHRGGDVIKYHVYAREQGFLDFKGNDWILVFHIPVKDAQAPVEELQREIAIMLLPIIIFSLFIAWLFSRAISRPLAKLRDAAIKIGSGEMDVNLEVKSKDEFGQLADSFNQMSKELRRSRNEFKAVIEGSADAVFVKDLEGRYLMINSAGADMIGKPEKEITGKDDTAFFPPETAMKIMGHDREIIDKRERITYEEILMVKGRELHFLTTKGVYNDSGGQLLGIYGVARDISELKRRAAELEKSNAELESFNRLAVGREIKMIELKREVNDLHEKLGLGKKYVIHK